MILKNTPDQYNLSTYETINSMGLKDLNEKSREHIKEDFDTQKQNQSIVNEELNTAFNPKTTETKKLSNIILNEQMSMSTPRVWTITEPLYIPETSIWPMNVDHVQLVSYRDAKKELDEPKANQLDLKPIIDKNENNSHQYIHSPKKKQLNERKQSIISNISLKENTSNDQNTLNSTPSFKMVY